MAAPLLNLKHSLFWGSLTSALNFSEAVCIIRIVIANLSYVYQTLLRLLKKNTRCGIDCFVSTAVEH